MGGGARRGRFAGIHSARALRVKPASHGRSELHSAQDIQRRARREVSVGPVPAARRPMPRSAALICSSGCAADADVPDTEEFP